MKINKMLTISLVIMVSLALSIMPVFAQNMKGRASRALPQPVPDTNSTDIRTGRYGEVMVQSAHGFKHVLSDEGSYFVATNPTPFTGIAATTSIVTFAETAGAVGVTLFVKNNEPRTSQTMKRIYLDSIKLLCTAAPTSATNWQYAITIDDSPVRYNTGGSAISPVNPNGDSNSASIAQIYFGAITTAVPTNRRLVARGTLKPTIPLVFDQFIIISGSPEGGGSFGGASGVFSKVVEGCPPIIIGPQQQLSLTMWGTSNAGAPSWEFELGWWEK